MHITDCWLYATLIFLLWGVNTCVSLNLFEGLSFSVNLSDLVCPLNVKESILFYSVHILEWIKNNISKCSSWRSYVHKSFVDLNITPALKKILFKMLQNGFFTPLLLISKLSGSTWDLVILWNRRPPRHIINWFLNGHTKVVFLLFSH